MNPKISARFFVFSFLLPTLVLTGCYYWPKEGEYHQTDIAHVVEYRGHQRYYLGSQHFIYETKRCVDTLSGRTVFKEKTKSDSRGAYTFIVKQKRWEMVDGKLKKTFSPRFSKP